MSDLTQSILNQELGLSAEEIIKITKESGSEWPEKLIEDYLTKLESLIQLARSLDINNDNTEFLLAQDGLSMADSRKSDVNDANEVNPPQQRVKDVGFPVCCSCGRRKDEHQIETFIPSRINRLTVDKLTTNSDLTINGSATISEAFVTDLYVGNIISTAISPNTNPTPAATVAQLEVKDNLNNTYYIPLYGAPW